MRNIKEKEAPETQHGTAVDLSVPDGQQRGRHQEANSNCEEAISFHGCQGDTVHTVTDALGASVS